MGSIYENVSSSRLTRVFGRCKSGALTFIIGVPELRSVQGKAIFAPYDRLPKAEFEKLGYPKPHVDWKKTKARAIETFKRDMKDADP